jgi:branched-chain amino acid transport system permease protein
VNAAVGRWFVGPLIGVGVLGAVVSVIMLWGTTSTKSNQDVVAFFLINLIIVLSLQLFSGNSGMLSFGHLAFVAVGAYVASMLTLDPSLKQQEIPGLPGFVERSHLSLVPATLVAMAVASVIATIAGLVFFRLSYSSTIIGIFALLLISNAVSGGWTRVTGGGGGIYGMPGYTTLATALVACLIALLVTRFFRDSSWGIKLRASREDEAAATAAGINIRRLRLAFWVASAALAAMAGSLLAHRITAISPTAFFLQPTFIVVAMLVIGGLTTVSGAVLGAIVVTAVREFTRPIEQKHLAIGSFHISSLTGLSEIILVLMILVTMYFRKEGLAGRLELDEYVERWRKLRRPHVEPEPPGVPARSQSTSHSA